MFLEHQKVATFKAAVGQSRPAYSDDDTSPVLLSGTGFAVYHCIAQDGVSKWRLGDENRERYYAEVDGSPDFPPSSAQTPWALWQDDDTLLECTEQMVEVTVGGPNHVIVRGNMSAIRKTSTSTSFRLEHFGVYARQGGTRDELAEQIALFRGAVAFVAPVLWATGLWRSASRAARI